MPKKHALRLQTAHITTCMRTCLYRDISISGCGSKQPPMCRLVGILLGAHTIWIYAATNSRRVRLKVCYKSKKNKKFGKEEEAKIKRLLFNDTTRQPHRTVNGTERAAELWWVSECALDFECKSYTSKMLRYSAASPSKQVFCWCDS